MSRTVSRRAILTGARGLALALPFLSSWRKESGFGVLSPRAARADGSGAPKRLIFWVAPWGTYHDLWTPGPDFTLNKLMEPLAPLRDKLTVLTGVNCTSLYAQNGRNSNHDLGGSNMLTSAGYDITYPWGPTAPFHHARGPSIDRVVADKIKSPTKFSSLFVGDGSDHHHTVVQDLAGNDLAPVYYPNQLFDQLFGDYSADGDARVRARLGRGSVLDAVLPSYQHLATRVSATDKRAVDEHLASIRELEKRVKNATVCVPPAKPGSETLYDDFVDLMAAAMACDLTRVATMSMAGQRAKMRSIVDMDALKPPNPDGDAHFYSHIHWNDPGNQAVYREFLLWRMRLLARFAQKLDSMPDVDGRSVLDNTCIVHTSDVATGLHDSFPLQEWGYSNVMYDAPPGSRPKGMPFLYLGGLGGTLKTGKHFDLSAGDTYGTALGKYSHGELYLTIARAMGISASELPSFGNKAVCKQTISEILA